MDEPLAIAVGVLKEGMRRKFRIPSVEEMKREAGNEAKRMGMDTKVITRFYAQLLVEVLTEELEKFEPFAK